MTRPTLQLGHSPDPDDAFMWWPLFEIDGAAPRLDGGRFRFVPVQQDIETLNERSEAGELEITAMSCAQYPRVRDKYAITACGASMGDAYGPRVVTRKPMTVATLRETRPRVAIPGERTSAFGALNLLLGRDAFDYTVVPFEEVMDEVVAGRCDAGLVIHEGQLTFGESGLHLVVDLGAWWSEHEGLPLPLGLNTVHRDLESRYGAGTL